MMYQVQDILLATPDSASKSDLASLQSKANSLQSGLANGSVKNTASAIADSGATASVLALRPLSQYPDVFMPVISAMSDGQYSKVVQAGNGFHILHLLDKRRVAATSSNMTLNQAREMVGQQQANQAIDKWLKNLRDTAFIKIN